VLFSFYAILSLQLFCYRERESIYLPDTSTIVKYNNIHWRRAARKANAHQRWPPIKLDHVSEKNSQNCYRHNFVKFLLNLIIFGKNMAKTMKLCEVHLFSISLNSCRCITMWNIDVPNCCITLRFFPSKRCDDLIKHKINLNVNACRSSEFMCKLGPTYLDATPLADSGINDRLIQRHSVID